MLGLLNGALMRPSGKVGQENALPLSPLPPAFLPYLLFLDFLLPVLPSVPIPIPQEPVQALLL